MVKKLPTAEVTNPIDRIPTEYLTGDWYPLEEAARRGQAARAALKAEIMVVNAEMARVMRTEKN